MGETGFWDDPDRHRAILGEDTLILRLAQKILRLLGNGSIVLQPFISARVAMDILVLPRCVSKRVGTSEMT